MTSFKRTQRKYVVEHLEAEVVVFGPGGHLSGVVEGEGFRRFPSAVVNTEIRLYPSFPNGVST